jgi:hypothetical protein
MKQDRHAERPLAGEPVGEQLIAATYRGLDPLVTDLARLDEALRLLLETGDTAREPEIRKLRQSLREVEPTVTMIGQVKAGKTTLVNAMIGRPGLLPADINPWTSVVTSLHVSPRITPEAQKSQFRFFTDAEWTALLRKGGRVGELASRAGADQELEKVRRQLEEMREKSRQRLGARFEMLLGQTHDYGYVDAALTQRYVCLGDEIDPALDAGADRGQGRFADITRSADLFLAQPALPMPICLRDTPGVNDTFMVREQITVNAIRASRLCVVVLSAHQALSTVDLALIRLIANIRSREVVLFVNRIDELSDPVREIPEIRDSIRATLRAQNGPADAEILFGSAHWAVHALRGELDRIGERSANALIALAEHALRQGLSESDAVAMVWHLSGLPALGQVLADRITRAEGAEVVDRTARLARNIAQGIAAGAELAGRGAAGRGPARPVDPRALAAAFDAIAAQAEADLAGRLDTALASLETRLNASRGTFLSRATAALLHHLDAAGDAEVWTYDPSGLRALLRSGYHLFTGKAARAAEAVFAETAQAVAELGATSFALDPERFALEPPATPEPPVPVMLGQTIALDIRGNWWTRWWRRRRSPQAYAEEFSALIDAEIAPVLTELQRGHAAAYADRLKALLTDFLAAERASLMDLAQKSAGDLAALRRQEDDDRARMQARLDRAGLLLSGFQRMAVREAAE